MWQMVKAWTIFSFCWATRWEFGKQRALWHIYPEQVLLFAGIELLPHIKSQERLKLRNGFTGQVNNLEAATFSVWPHLHTWGAYQGFAACIWTSQIPWALKGFHTATKILSKLAELSACLRCKTRSKGKKNEPLNTSCRCLFRSVDKFDYRRERKATLLSWFLQAFNSTWYFSCIFTSLVWMSVW